MSSECRTLTPCRWRVEAETYVGAFDLLVTIQCICWFFNFWFVIMMHGQYNVKPVLFVQYPISWSGLEPGVWWPVVWTGWCHVVSWLPILDELGRLFKKGLSGTDLDSESPCSYHHIFTAFVTAAVNTPSLVVRLLPVRLPDFLWRLSTSQATQSRNDYRTFSARKWLLLMIGLNFGDCEACWILSALHDWLGMNINFIALSPAHFAI